MIESHVVILFDY